MIEHILVAFAAAVVAWRAYMHGYHSGRLSVLREQFQERDADE